MVREPSLYDFSPLEVEIYFMAQQMVYLAEHCMCTSEEYVFRCPSVSIRSCLWRVMRRCSIECLIELSACAVSCGQENAEASHYN